MNVQLTGKALDQNKIRTWSTDLSLSRWRDVEVWSIRRAHLFDGSCCREDFSVPSTESVDRKGISMIFEGIFFNICESDAKYVHLISYLIAAVSIWRRSPKGGHRCGVIFRWFFVARSEWFSVGCWGHVLSFLFSSTSDCRCLHSTTIAQRRPSMQLFWGDVVAAIEWFFVVFCGEIGVIFCWLCLCFFFTPRRCCAARCCEIGLIFRWFFYRTFVPTFFTPMYIAARFFFHYTGITQPKKNKTAYANKLSKRFITFYLTVFV